MKLVIKWKDGRIGNVTVNVDVVVNVVEMLMLYSNVHILTPGYKAKRNRSNSTLPAFTI